MPRNQGTSRKGKPKKEMRSAGFGKALQRSQTKRFVPKSNGSSAHGQGMLSTGAATIGIEAPSETAKMKSILEIDDLSDFLVQAQLANRDFVSEREQFLDVDDVAREYVPTGQMGGAAFIYDEASATSRSNMDGPNQSFAFHELSVPRRPAWTPGVTTPAELEAMENESFLDWRRGVARREEEIAALSGGRGGVTGASVTPYEKNLQVWRQLWRVLERSSVVLQIVDARNPLFYVSDDLRKYAKEELGKPMLIVVNKSDFLTLRQRKSWSEYFTRKGVDHLFFSAYEEQKKIDDAVSGTKRQTNDSHEDSIDTDDRNVVSDHDENDSDGGSSCSLDESARGSAKGHDELSKEAAVTECGGPVSHVDSGNNSLDSTNLLTREELLDALDTFARSHGCVPDEKYDNNRIQYGMVGFPNVGKSSVINVLVGSSKNAHGVVRVAVAAQPGKTKHFQTLLLPDRSDIMLCDCPGLVFPSFVSSTADMIAAGVYPIAQMRDHWPVVSLICKRVPRDVLNAHYGIRLPQPSNHELRERGWVGKTLPPPTAEELLGTYCIARSMIAPESGVPDYQRASRVVVKDYSAGKLLYCHSPPPLFDGYGGSLANDDEEYQRETLATAIRNTSNSKKLQKLEHSLEVAAKAERGVDDDDEIGEFESFLDELEDDNKGDKRGKAHKSIKKWGKKGRKLMNKDPYGCHPDLDSVVLQSTPSTSGSIGAIVNAGKYTSGYTRPNYAGAKAATPFDGCVENRPRKGRQ